MRFHKLQNVQIALNYLKHRQVRMGRDPRDAGNPRGCAGLPVTPGAVPEPRVPRAAGEAGEHPER